MAFFKSKQEKEIIAQMEREEQMEVFNEQITQLKNKRQEYANIAAEAEVNGDEGSYQVAVNALLELNDVISSLTQAKANFDMINVANATAVNIAMAVNVLDNMTNGTVKMPDIKKIQKVNAKVSKYMKQVKISQKAMSSTMKTANPANKSRSQAELDSVRPMIDAARAKITGSPLPVTSNLDISAEIEAEKKKII